MEGRKKNEKEKEKLLLTGRCENKRTAAASSSSSSGFELQWRSVAAELCLARRGADRLMEIGGEGEGLAGEGWGEGRWLGGRRQRLISE